MILIIMTDFRIHETSRAMQSSTIHHAFLISWIHCIIVIWCSVTMVTQSTDDTVATGTFNNSVGHASRSLESFLSVVSVPCPPHNHLQLLCDQSLAYSGSTCHDRALIIEKCLQRFPGLYNNSQWNACYMNVNYCERVSIILRSYGFINHTINNENSVTIASVSVIITSTLKPDLTTSSTIPSTSDISPTTNSFTSSTTSSSPKPTSTKNIKPTINQADSSNVTATKMMEDAVKAPGSGEHPAISYIYPIIGAFIITFEILILCMLSCYKKRRERQNIAGSLVLQEEVIEPETVSPTKALYMNRVYDEDTVVTEDQTIYKSYINLRFIDDSSNESTPEKMLLRT